MSQSAVILPKKKKIAHKAYSIPKKIYTCNIHNGGGDEEGTPFSKYLDASSV